MSDEHESSLNRLVVRKCPAGSFLRIRWEELQPLWPGVQPSDGTFCCGPDSAEKGEGTYVKVVEISKITNEPQEFTFELKQQDGWYLSTASLSGLDSQR